MANDVRLIWSNCMLYNRDGSEVRPACRWFLVALLLFAVGFDEFVLSYWGSISLPISFHMGYVVVLRSSL
jgi:hypothetical protein